MICGMCSNEFDEVFIWNPWSFLEIIWEEFENVDEKKKFV